MIDATPPGGGLHFLTVRAYRHQPDGSPAVFSEFKRVIYIDRAPPVSAVEGFRPSASTPSDTEVRIRSVDLTADNVHVFANLPTTTDADVMRLVSAGQGALQRVDRALFTGTLHGLGQGTHTLTIVTFRSTGSRNIQRVTAVRP